MGTIQEIQNTFNSLNSEEGTIQFISQHTLIPRERVERIYRLGSPWPMWENQPELSYFSTIRDRKVTVEGVSITTALNSLASLRQWDMEHIKIKLEDFMVAREHGEHPEPIPELEWPEAVKDHFNEVVVLSGEKFDVIQEVFVAELARLKRLLHMIKEVTILKSTR